MTRSTVRTFLVALTLGVSALAVVGGGPAAAAPVLPAPGTPASVAVTPETAAGGAGAAAAKIKHKPASKAVKKAALEAPPKKLSAKQKKAGEKKAKDAWARAMKHRPSPAAARVPVDAYTFCNPFNRRHFCSPLDYLHDYMNDAYDWSHKHTSKDDRRPVPFPSDGTGKGVKIGYVYVITWRPTGFVGPVNLGTSIWKFGETAQSSWVARAGTSYALCEASKRRSCSVELAAVTTPLNGKYWARFVEASAVKKWNNDYGGGSHGAHWYLGIACPPGQRYSCR